MFPFSLVIILIGILISLKVKSPQPLQYFFLMACVVTLFDIIMFLGNMFGDYGLISSVIAALVAIPGLIYVDKKTPMFHDGD